MKITPEMLEAATDAIIDVYVRHTMNSARMLKQYNRWPFQLAARAALEKAFEKMEQKDASI